MYCIIGLFRNLLYSVKCTHDFCLCLVNRSTSVRLIVQFGTEIKLFTRKIKLRCIKVNFFEIPQNAVSEIPKNI
jgi:hypothetical protein